ncbi:hypothetical protein [Streptomyces tateyamensis]|uniref:hypothetical protein n=1 Tax=Streptomyces tateyamensis TaxID=565073 RepID=UPI0011B82D5B|nr:hypothetical protein [Streptomyces tateyamensis]
MTTLSEKDIVRGPRARELWKLLPAKARRQTFKSARRRQPISDPETAALAVGWARQVLGGPGRRPARVLDQLGYVFMAFITTPSVFAPLDVFDGDEKHDLNPYVRWLARQIEKTNPVHG